MYSLGATGHLLALDTRKGTLTWERILNRDYDLLHLTLNGDSILLSTDEGNLIGARLDAAGYHELSRVHLIEPDYQFGARKVVFAPLAFADRQVFARNNKEIISASLARK